LTAEVDKPLALRTRARISAHVVWDHLVQPRALEAEDVPWSADALTPEWLSRILCEAHPGARVVALDVGEGSQGSSVRRRIRVTYNGEGQGARLPAHLFAKTTPTLLTRLSSGMVAPREGAFFRCIRPELPIEAPVHFHTAYDPTSGRAFHLFEDLVASRGARFCNQDTAITCTQAEEIIDMLAQIHARFIDSPRFSRDLAWLGDYENNVKTSARTGSRTGHDRAMLRAEHVIPADVSARKDRIWPLLLQGLAAHAEEPRTLLHSDVHLGNWYITADEHMGLGDWALVCKGHWARDVCYALCTALAVDDRRAWERGLLRRYLERLREHGGREIGFEHAWTRYRQQTFAALVMWTPTLCHSPLMPDMQPEAMSLEMIRRITQAISDLDSFVSYADA